MKLEGLPFKVTLTPSLPLERIEKCVPFNAVVVDFAGPLEVDDLCGQHTFKSYICVFTCDTTRAIHLELVESLSTESLVKLSENSQLVGDCQPKSCQLMLRHLKLHL